MRQAKILSLSEFSAMLRDPKTVNGTTFAGFDALTEMKLNKFLSDKTTPNPHYGKVRKVLSSQVAMLFSDKTTSAYENMVNKRLALEGKPAEFTVGQRAWGTRVEGTSFLFHTTKEGVYDEYLFVVYCESPVTLHEYVQGMGIELNANDAELIEAMKKRVVGMESKSGKTEYVLLGVDEQGNATETPIAFDEIQGKPPAKTEGKQGGLSEEMKVIPRTFKLNSIQRITMGGVDYLIQNV